LVQSTSGWTFSQHSPWQPPHAEMQCKPLFRHIHIQIRLQLHLITFNNSAGAGSKSVVMGTNVLPFNLHPQSVALVIDVFSAVHCITWRCTCRLWQKAIAIVSVCCNFSGRTGNVGIFCIYLAAISCSSYRTSVHHTVKASLCQQMQPYLELLLHWKYLSLGMFLLNTPTFRMQMPFHDYIQQRLYCSQSLLVSQAAVWHLMCQCCLNLLNAD